MVEKDVVIIGSGVAGITAAIYLKRSNISFALLDKNAPGGKLNNIHRIDNYPGVASIDGPELAMKFVEQAYGLGIEFTYGEVSSVSQADRRFTVKSDVEEYSCLALIIATGLINSSSSMANETKFKGKGVSYCATCDGNFFKGKDVLVYGYKDHAVEDAIYLSSLANKVYFLHDSPLDSPAAHVETMEGKENIAIIEGKPLRINGEDKVASVDILMEGKEINIPVSAVFPLCGEISSTQFLQNMDVGGENGFICVDSDGNTSVPGIFAAGDIVKKKLRQIVNAAGEGAVAATSAISYVHAVKKKALG